MGSEDSPSPARTAEAGRRRHRCDHASGSSQRALSVLEYPRVLEHVASFAATGAGRSAVLAMTPTGDAAEVQARLEAVTETRRFLARRPQWTLSGFVDPGDALSRLALEGSVLAGPDLVRLGSLLGAAGSLRRALAEDARDLPGLQALRERLFADRGLAASIGRAVGEDGRVLDTASKELARLRSRLAGAHRRVVAHLEAVLAKLAERYRVADASVTIRDGRYVIPVRREGKAVVGGYVHDESASGATVFAEPPSAIVMTNAVREMERAAEREVHRILRELTGRCRPFAAAFSASLAALAEMDQRVALARTADDWDGHAPEMSAAAASLSVRRGRHPLLAAARSDPVPFDLDLEPGGAVVVVTGPNAGGKTVFLKSVGLISALAQSGVIPPVGPGTRLPAFRSFFADIGDEQSISDSLSTFSAHLRNLGGVLAGACDGSLVLVDEPGAGTDPREGEALARALVETLADRGCVAVVTSHLGGLKRLAASGNRVFNASLEFDAEQIEPTFRFLWGRPGRSYGLAMARSLGFPAATLDLADRFRDDADARLDELLSSLQKQEGRASRLSEQLGREREHARARLEGLERRERAVLESEQSRLAEARARARRMLLDARREVEEAIARLEARVAAGHPLEEAARQARRSVETAARALQETDSAAAGHPAKPPPHGQPAGPVSPPDRLDAQPPSPGQWVAIAGSGACGRVVALDGDRAEVDAGGLRMRVPLVRLRPADEGAASRNGRPPQRSRRPQDPQPSHAFASNPSPEIDLRGQRPDEAETSLARAVDDAVVAGLRDLRVIHGKGTGALRERVARVLGEDPRVEEFRPGGPGEGGYGVTVARVG